MTQTPLNTNPPSDSLNHLLQQAIEHTQQGQWQETIALCQVILGQDETVAAAHHLLGLAALQQRQLPVAIEHFQRAIECDPGQAEYHNHLGVAYCYQGNLEQGMTAYERAIDLAPDAIDVRYNLVIGWQKLNQTAAAIEQGEAVLQREPRHIATHYQLGNLLQKQSQFVAAAQHYRQAIAWLSQRDVVDLAINRSFPVRFESVWYNLGIALQSLGEMSEAIEAYQQALQMNPQYGEVYNALGALYYQQGQEAEAWAAYQQALVRLPDYLPLLSNLGVLELKRQEWGAARSYFRRIVELDKDSLKGVHGLLQVAMETCDWSELQPLTDRLWELGKQQICTDIAIYGSLFLPLSLAQQQMLAENYAQAVAQKAAALKQTLSFQFTDRQVEQNLSSRSNTHLGKIRLGYVSGDYRNQAVGHLLYRLFELHDHQQFEIYAYSLGPNDGSMYRQKYEADSDCFRDVYNGSTRAIAQQIYDDRIDILIDLEGHTEYQRMEVYALRPAPVIVTYAGHLGTMGADYIDYAIVDPIVMPAAHSAYFTERCVYLPDFFLVTNDEQPIVPNRQRSDFGIPDDAFVFCAHHKVQKLEPLMFHTWMRIMQQVPNSVLKLEQLHPEVRQNLTTIAAQYNITADRLLFATRVDKPEYLAALQQSDLFLDSLRHNAIVTGIDALWVGVPLLTCPGETFCARSAASLLTAAGIPELITSSLEDYERLAVHLATHPDELKAIRQKLVQGRSQSRLFNAAQTVRHLETAYQQIWQIYQNGESPREIYVQSIENQEVQAEDMDDRKSQVDMTDQLQAREFQTKVSVDLNTDRTKTTSMKTAPMTIDLSKFDRANSTTIQPTGLPSIACLDNVLTAEELEFITTKLEAAQFADGKRTAGAQAEAVKFNQQIEPSSPLGAELGKTIVHALTRHPLFHRIAYPKVIRPPLFNRYDTGMTYGTHIDSALMGQTSVVRSDLSITVFLSDPARYGGGELVLEFLQSAYSFKLVAGSAIVYPSTMLHRVEPVTHGTRLAAITWVQSLVRAASDRELLFDLDTVRQELFEQLGKTRHVDLLNKTYTNLLRKWVDV